MHVLADLINPLALVRTAGLIGVLAVVFAESGLFFGFFLPGDSLLFAAGLLASQGLFSLSALVIGTALAAVLGDSVGYWFGKKVGPHLFTREDSRFFKKKHLIRSHEFFERYGSKTLVLARFVPIVRTFAPIIAGIGTMKYRTFLAFNVIGGIGWTVLLSLAGYFLGTSIPNIDHYILPIVLLIALISFAPIAFEYRKAKSR